MRTGTTPADVDILVRLNEEYINAVKKSDVAWFKKILAPEGTA